MKRLLQITLITCIFAGSALSAQAQKRAQHTSSGRAAYGNAVEFKDNKKRNQKKKMKAIKSAKRKGRGTTASAYFRGRPY